MHLVLSQAGYLHEFSSSQAARDEPSSSNFLPVCTISEIVSQYPGFQTKQKSVSPSQPGADDATTLPPTPSKPGVGVSLSNSNTPEHTFILDGRKPVTFGSSNKEELEIWRGAILEVG